MRSPREIRFLIRKWFERERAVINWEVGGTERAQQGL